MGQNAEKNFYVFTARSVGMLIQRVAEAVCDRCRRAADVFTIFERGPGLYCTGRVTGEGYRLLTWRQVPGFIDEDAFAKCWEEPIAARGLARLATLGAVRKEVTLHVALGHVPPELKWGPPRWLLRAKRAMEKRRIDPLRPYPLPYADDEWHPAIQKAYANREALWWRTCCIEPHKQTADDVFLLLALMLCQEQMIPAAEAATLHAAMVHHLYAHLPRRADKGTALLAFDRLLHNFIEPASWQGLDRYIRSYLSWYRRALSWEGDQEPAQVFSTRRRVVEGQHVAVEDALTSFQADGLPATRSPLFRWAHAWTLCTHGLAGYDDKGGLWLTSAGRASARARLLQKELTQLQIMMGKDKEAARKFTARHKGHIQEAATRGAKLAEIAKGLHLPMRDRVSRYPEWGSDT